MIKPEYKSYYSPSERIKDCDSCIFTDKTSNEIPCRYCIEIQDKESYEKHLSYDRSMIKAWGITEEEEK